MSNLTHALVNSGLIPQRILQQFAKWRLPIELPEDLISPLPEVDPDLSLRKIRDAVETAAQKSHTDFDLVADYLGSQKIGRIAFADGDVVESVYGMTRLGEYILRWPWDENEVDIVTATMVMTDGETHLKTAGGGRIYFKALREFDYAGRRAFLVCTVAKEENDG